MSRPRDLQQQDATPPSKAWAMFLIVTNSALMLGCILGGALQLETSPVNAAVAFGLGFNAACTMDQLYRGAFG